MKKKIRFPIRIKLAIMSTISIAVAVATLGVFLGVSFAKTSYETAENTLRNVSTNATLALKSSISTTETSMKLLANQIGYNKDFANNITKFKTDPAAKAKIKDAMAGGDGVGDGSTIAGAMDYLVISDPDIKSTTMYSPYVDEDVQGRLMPPSESKVPYTEEKYQKLISNPGSSLWFFQGNDLYVWKALANYGVDNDYNMTFVGYIEYGFDRREFLNCLSDTAYTNEGMILLDDNNQVVLNVSSGLAKVDDKILKNIKTIPGSLKRNGDYTTYKVKIEEKGWTYIAFINHRSIDRTVANSRNLTLLIVGVSVVIAAVVAYLLAAREIRRIKNLSKAAGAISNGDYDVRLSTNTRANDEIADVSESFNTMAGKVQDALQELILQQDSISENFAIILSNKSGESGNHVKRVSEYSAILAEELGFNPNEVHDIRIASMLHDVGKIMVDENILHKPGRFTDEEYKIMQEHVVYGGQLLRGVPGNIMQLGAIIAEYHHERWDGNGYVKHLKGDEIPKEAQIASVADVFDALVSKRCYKGAWTIEEAYAEIINQSGKQFSPVVVEAFKRRFEDFKRISDQYKEE